MVINCAGQKTAAWIPPPSENLPRAMFDEAKIYVRSGDGGDGIVAFRREKRVPQGGPSGGDGGRGGDVTLRVNPRIHTLRRFERQTHYSAKAGGRGRSSRKTGASAKTLYVDVPPGTLVRTETGEILADLVTTDDTWRAAKGGRGGRGNCRFVSPQQQTPRLAEKGAPGEAHWLKLELRLLADIGIVGLPNAGKSTLLSVISKARPRIADYPFTTIEPNLGVVLLGDCELIVADIPGLLEGAHRGVGLGHTFLRHLMRTRLLVHLIDGSSPQPLADFALINAELVLFAEELEKKPQIIVINKQDLPSAEAAWPQLDVALREQGNEPLAISAATHMGIMPLIRRLFAEYDTLPPLKQETNMPTLSLLEPAAEPLYTIRRDRTGRFIVRGQRIERAAAMTYWEYEESVHRFQQILGALGITDALSAEGVQVGDTVMIGNRELEWGE